MTHDCVIQPISMEAKLAARHRQADRLGLRVKAWRLSLPEMMLYLAEAGQRHPGMFPPPGYHWTFRGIPVKRQGIDSQPPPGAR